LILLSLSELIGRFHPVVVHLPIGILALAGLFLLLPARGLFAGLRSSITPILFIGLISAVFSCITGYVLSGSGDYPERLIGIHQWMGIGVTVITGVILLMRIKTSEEKWQWLFGAVLLLLLLLTGHQGGSLTHGEDYLAQPLNSILGRDEPVIIKRKPLPDVQEAMAYAEVVRPVLQAKCFGCHSASKQKGKLRMDQPSLLMKGGKNGEIIVPGKSAESEMIIRILLPKNDEHHMAPKDKPQATEQETALLTWWIDNGASFDKKVKELPQPDPIKPVLLALEHEEEEEKSLPNIPLEPVEPADEQAIQALRDAGAAVLPVAAGSHYLSASFFIASDSGDLITPLLLPLKRQLAWVKMGNTKISDASLEILGQCVNLTRLNLNHSRITDEGLAYLAPLTQLQSLSLVGTPVTASGIAALKELKSLRSLYLYQTNVQQGDWQELKRLFPDVMLDSGGYKLPFLATDTQQVKAPARQND